MERMTKDVINEQYQLITRLLEAKRLNEALAQIEGYLYSGRLETKLPELHALKTSYQYMLQYMRQGSKDPERYNFHRQLIAKAYELAEHIHIELLDEIEPTFFHHTRMHWRTNPFPWGWRRMVHELEHLSGELEEAFLGKDENLNAIQKKHEACLSAIVMLIWCNDRWSADDEQEALDMLASESFRKPDTCLLISAVTLSAIECFDERKVNFLIEASNYREQELAQRGYVGLVLVIQRHATRIHLYSALEARLSMTFDAKILTDIYIQLLYSQESKKIERMMNEEIMPEMIKTAQSLRNQERNWEKEDLEENDVNPDWELAFSPEFNDKIRELGEMHQSGADIYLSAFSQMRRHPFFGKAENWLYMFDPMHSSISGLFKDDSDYHKNPVYILLSLGKFCNSDKYSFCFSLQMAPTNALSALMSRFSSEMDDDDLNFYQKRNLQSSVISNRYIHDLYRFFTVSTFKSESFNFFEERIALHRLPILKDVFDEEELINVANFLFQKERTDEALDIYRLLIDNQWLSHHAEIFQKAGYCLQKEKKYDQALEMYRYADAVYPENIWTVRHIATCYRLTKQYLPAIDAYRRVESVEPENLNTLIQLGNCYTEAHQITDALKYFFKVEFLDENNVRAWRGIAWCSLVVGKYQQAMKYYRKLLADKPSTTDYLNAGHTAWLMKEIEETIQYYDKAVERCGSKDAFLQLFDKDRDILIKQGIAEEDIPLMMDLI
ncbi:MAG: hypothetical protein LBN06_08860 [Prevotellaceae bacterium]|jgi:tetratricopeptide (TPR) repeat protein|nr:hypothetical protein [Prevotellaceae bacterium]